ncbi:MAG: FkbM family methyltransferase [Clostridiales bacterium]
MTSRVLEKMQTVCAKLEDEKSRETFINRLLFQITGDIEYINKIPGVESLGCEKNNQGFPELNKLLDKIRKDERLVIYGAGVHGAYIDSFLRKNNISVSCFWDRNPVKQAKGFMGKKVIPPTPGEERIIIASKAFLQEMTEYLLSLGIQKKNIISLEYAAFRSDTNKQYFDPEIIRFSKNEVFVDAGAYNLETSLKLLEECDSVRKIYAFEPDNANSSIIASMIEESGQKNIELIKAGLWSKSDVLRLLPDGTNSQIAENGTDAVQMITLDEAVDDEVTFIKMDIEGSELEALKGAKKTILKYKPKLAICIYHKPEDFIDIPLYINNILPEYKLYMRHYTNNTYETVLYAVI